MDMLTMMNLIRIRMLLDPSKVTPTYINQQLRVVSKDSEEASP
jgi:hypothetical protein